MEHLTKPDEWQSLETVISMHIQNDSFVLKFIKKLNGYNPSFLKNNLVWERKTKLLMKI